MSSTKNQNQLILMKFLGPEYKPKYMLDMDRHTTKVML